MRSAFASWPHRGCRKLWNACVARIEFMGDEYNGIRLEAGRSPARGAAIGMGLVTLGVGALMALTKSKKHFVGLTWANGEQKGGFAMQCDKSDYRGVLTGLTGLTGRRRWIRTR